MNDMEKKLFAISMGTLVLVIGTFVMSTAAPQIEQSITDFRPVQISDFGGIVIILIIFAFVGLIFTYLRCSGETA